MFPIPPTQRRSTLAIVRSASVIAVAVLAAACSEPRSDEARPRLLSIEAAQLENASALERLGVEQVVGPVPARFMKFEACLGKSNTCLESQQKADRID
jgi:hypothetical protein